MNTFFEKASELENSDKPFIVATLISIRGSAPQELGAKAIITSDGICWGTVGGGKIEARVIDVSKDTLIKLDSKTNRIFRHTWNLQRDIGMTCGGEVDVLFEIHQYHPWKIIIFGAGHIAQTVIRSLLSLKCQITCIETRSEWLNKLPESAKLKKILCQNLTDPISDLPQDAFYLVMTQGHSTDVPVLKNILLKGTPPYFGNIGSDIKAIKIRRDLKEAGFIQEIIDQLHCPMGLPIGSNDLAEMSISICAELIQVRDAIHAPKATIIAPTTRVQETE